MIYFFGLRMDWEGAILFFIMALALFCLGAAVGAFIATIDKKRGYSKCKNKIPETTDPNVVIPILTHYEQPISKYWSCWFECQCGKTLYPLERRCVKCDKIVSWYKYYEDVDGTEKLRSEWKKM